MKKTSALWLCLLLILLCGCQGTSQESRLMADESQEISQFYALDYMDPFEGFPIYDAHGKQVDRLPKRNQKTLVFYARVGCPPCMQNLKAFSLMEALYASEDLGLLYLWETGQSEQLRRRYDLPDAQSFSLQSKTQLEDRVPSYFLLDEEQRLLFRSLDFLDIQKKLAEEGLSAEDARKRGALAYLEEAIADQREASKVQVFLFALPSHEKSEALQDMLAKEKGLQVHRVYPDGRKVLDGLRDHRGLLANSLELQAYPSLFYLDSDGALQDVDPALDERAILQHLQAQVRP